MSPSRFERELFAEQGSEVGAPEDHIAPGQERVKGPGSQLLGHRLEGLDREEGDGGVHVRGLAEEPVADDALAGHQFHLVRVRRGDLRRTIAGAAEVGVRRRDEEVQNLDVVPVACRHALKLSSLAWPRPVRGRELGGRPSVGARIAERARSPEPFGDLAGFPRTRRGLRVVAAATMPDQGTSTIFPFAAVLPSSSWARRTSESGRRSATTG